MSLFKEFATNAEKEVQGVEVTFGPNEDGTVPTFTISRMAKSNKRYQKAAEVAYRPHQRAIKLGTLSNEVAQQVMLDLFVDAVLVKFENIQDQNGKVLKTKAEIKDLLTVLPDLYAELEEKAQSVAMFRDEDLADSLGN